VARSGQQVKPVIIFFENVRCYGYIILKGDNALEWTQRDPAFFAVLGLLSMRRKSRNTTTGALYFLGVKALANGTS
jgi:hypothetical protein